MGPARLYAPWVAAPRAGAALPSHPRPRESWDPRPLARSVRRPHIALRSRAMIFILSHQGHARDILCYSSTPGPLGATATARVPPVTPTPLFTAPLLMSRDRRPPAPFSLQQTMSDRSTPSEDSPSPAPDTGRGGALRRGPFPMFLMDIAQSDDADRLLWDLDMLKDDALQAADEAVRAPDPALSDLCDALRWTAADGNIQAITAVTGA